jgi:hypothetical protein
MSLALSGRAYGLLLVLAAGVEQLPLRQTAQKPMLKYQPVAKQLQAYHQSETLYTPHDGRNAYGNYGQPATLFSNWLVFQHWFLGSLSQR